ncbi:HIT family protein [Legionella jordanis]|uniref:Histidine triad (HIT) protein n=1 Tax=Legionella jordanis TaxID=456 RepID=A0A0W0V7M6_9GAMM|nr:HIT family protein [Legionella jordanis]KTD16110.1 Histidine triad (HIT) protein [Legionella jordanis]RMX04659.1 HIT family protein [Legionella jordanis]RMX18369.1 HIT family protein [Legionella jordanis]VEH12430.1 Histidine triad (HIT) protein [Legionella jordanis]HAT8713941.1 HIT domain-containing protein [Legionella jordanis]
MPNTETKPCIIDSIISKQENAYLIFEDAHFIAFLDHRPLFPGHTLLAPKKHTQTLTELDDDLIAPLFLLTKRMAKAVESAMEAHGSFVAMNNVVSQSIPHLHIHIVPRNKGDGLKGFFWPRTKYKDEGHILETQQKIRNCLSAYL